MTILCRDKKNDFQSALSKKYTKPLNFMQFFEFLKNKKFSVRTVFESKSLNGIDWELGHAIRRAYS